MGLPRESSLVADITTLYQGKGRTPSNWMSHAHQFWTPRKRDTNCSFEDIIDHRFKNGKEEEQEEEMRNTSEVGIERKCQAEVHSLR